MPKSITILISKEFDLVKLKQFSIVHNYYADCNRNNCLIIEQEYNPINVSRSYIMADISTNYIDLAIEEYLEFDNLNDEKITIIKNCSFLTMQYNDTIFLYTYLNDFFKYTQIYYSHILIDDDYGELFTIEEFKTKYWDNG